MKEFRKEVRGDIYSDMFTNVKIDYSIAREIENCILEYILLNYIVMIRNEVLK